MYRREACIPLRRTRAGNPMRRERNGQRVPILSQRTESQEDVHAKSRERWIFNAERQVKED